MSVFAVTFVVFCVLKESLTKSLPELYQNVLLVTDDGTLAVQGLEIFPKIGVDDKGQSFGTISIESPIALEKAVVINTEAAKNALSALDPDTKKQYYLLKVKEYYDFLPLSRQEHDKYLRLEIVDRGDMGYFDKSERDDGEDVLAQGLVKRDALRDPLSSSGNSEQKYSAKQTVINKDKGDLKMSVKREISDDTLAQNINIFQTHYMGKRDVLDSPIAKLYQRNLVSDLGNFDSNSETLTSDPDDPQNNNFRYVAYVPFFRVRKYYIERKRLDVGL